MDLRPIVTKLCKIKSKITYLKIREFKKERDKKGKITYGQNTKNSIEEMFSSKR